MRLPLKEGERGRSGEGGREGANEKCSPRGMLISRRSLHTQFYFVTSCAAKREKKRRRDYATGRDGVSL